MAHFRVRRAPKLLIAFAIIVAAAANARAQVPTMPSPLAPTFAIGRPVEDLTALTTLYNSGRWTELQAAAQALIDAAIHRLENPAAPDPIAHPEDVAAALDTRRNYVLVTWIGDDPFGKTMLARVVVHAPAREAYSADLPGIGAASGEPQFIEVFLSRGVRGKIVSVYTSTRDKNPLEEQFPAFVQAIGSPLFAAVGTFAGNVTTRHPAAQQLLPPKPELATIGVTVGRVGLPFRRATIKWKAAAKEPVALEDFVDQTATFTSDLLFTEITNNRCARLLVNHLATEVPRIAASPACLGSSTTTAQCRKAFDDAFVAAFGEVVPPDAADAPAACKPLSRDDRAAVEQVDHEFRQFVSKSLTTSVEAEGSFKNAPLTHWAFGAGAGVLAAASLSEPRVKLDDDNNLAADPLGRVVTTAFVNWSPVGYDSTTEKLAPAERVRGMFGVTLTPDFGVTAGVNVLIVRGIGVSAGWVLMFAKGADQAAIGKPPANPDKAFQIAYANGLLVGITYNFK